MAEADASIARRPSSGMYLLQPAKVSPQGYSVTPAVT